MTVNNAVKLIDVTVPPRNIKEVILKRNFMNANNVVRTIEIVLT